MSENTTPALRLENVSKSFGEFAAVSDLSLTVRRGRVYGLLGPNGAGKTTTIRMIVNIIAPDAGTIELFGRPMGVELMDRLGYLPEERGLYKKMRVGDQLRYFAQLKGMTARAADAAADRWLARLNLSEWKAKKTDELSKGMQQKVQFVATVMHDPDLLILDEVFSGLDPVSREAMITVLEELKSEGRTIIFSTHQMEQAERLCDDICLINRSRKILEGSLREVKRGFGRRAVALRAEGADGALDDPAIVAGVKRLGDHDEVLLGEGADAQELLRRLVARGANVMRFEMIEPSLHDIFLQQVGGDAAPAAGAGGASGAGGDG
ncbi:MAG TPA: ATP-binding cassette domain-containing protein [Pyrinomonadaceae bacterium]|nr:ATP-binding cassette domain-containing protein [Pyrinomonadaceae bacterium]